MALQWLSNHQEFCGGHPEVIGVLYCHDELQDEVEVSALRRSVLGLPLVEVEVGRHFRTVRCGPGRKQTRRVEVKPFTRKQHKLMA